MERFFFGYLLIVFDYWIGYFGVVCVCMLGEGFNGFNMYVYYNGL